MLETKSIAALQFNETPRKRKRETTTTTTSRNNNFPPLSHKGTDAVAAAASAATTSCFTNAAFSSTPKKLIGRRRLAKETENRNPFVGHSGLEIKSISELVTAQQALPPLNPYEVTRQPSKKKKRDHACFENPGLNLEGPERQFNPYEVVRSVATPTQCFVNEALNLRGSDAPASLNPFEIHRRSDVSAAAGNPAGVENPALSEDQQQQLPTNLKIGLPFAPTVGCRIDFNGISLSQLTTPSKLFAEKLVFSPVPGVETDARGKRSLGAISEESSMDIGKELDRYQLELENSINEAKLRKKGIVLEEQLVVETKLVMEQQQTVEQPQQLERHIVCTTRRSMLTEISEANEQQEEEEEQGVEDPTTESTEQLELLNNNDDVAYASESEDDELPAELEDELDFKAPSRFVRSYRPAAKHNSQAGSKESLQSIASSKSNKSAKSLDSNQVHGHGMRNMIRKSIRKLMHPKDKDADQDAPVQPEHHHHGSLLSSIRHSLRRRPQRPQSVLLESKPADLSIVDGSERTMKLRSSVPQTEYMPIEQLTNEKKHTLRNSIRRSTRDVLRHVFHKSQDAYATAK